MCRSVVEVKIRLGAARAVAREIVRGVRGGVGRPGQSNGAGGRSGEYGAYSERPLHGVPPFSSRPAFPAGTSVVNSVCALGL